MHLAPNVRYADIDFERETLGEGLRRCGVSPETPTFFSWLGVTMYLTREAIADVLWTVAQFPAGSELVLTFAPPRDADDASGGLAARAAEVGEPWLSYFAPDEMERLLRASGFRTVHLLSPDEARARYYADRADALPPPRRTTMASAIV